MAKRAIMPTQRMAATRHMSLTPKRVMTPIARAPQQRVSMARAPQQRVSMARRTTFSQPMRSFSQRKTVQTPTVRKLSLPRNNVIGMRSAQFTMPKRNFWVIDEAMHFLGMKTLPRQTPAELAKQIGVPEQLILDPEHHLLMMRTQTLFEKLGVHTKEQQEKYLNSHIISPGHMTLEWTLPNPPPWHTFEEPVMIKEAPEGHSHH